MDTKIVSQAARSTLDGTMAFPEIVRQLLATGVEYYHVDYVTLRQTFYSAEGNAVAVPIAYEGLPPVAGDFDAAKLRAAILDSQRHGQKYRDFTRRAMAAGVQGGILLFCAVSASLILVAAATSTRNGFRAPARRRPDKSGV